jgi:hypothetical protein
MHVGASRYHFNQQISLHHNLSQVGKIHSWVAKMICPWLPKPNDGVNQYDEYGMAIREKKGDARKAWGEVS